MLKVLLVEDNEMNRTMLLRRLARQGFEVAAASDGREALAAVRENRPDVIVMDMSLPNVDGWDATRQLKEDPDTRAIPVIALTAHAMAEDRRRALDAGCDQYATKPIDLPRLIRMIRDLAESRPET